MKRFRSMCTLLAALLFFGVGSAHALLVSVQVTWGYPGGLENPEALGGYNLQEGSIIQIVAYDSTAPGITPMGPGQHAIDPNDPTQNFTEYGNGVYLPDTTPELHEIVATGTIEHLGGGVYGMTTWIDLPYAYDSLYVRVFEAKSFEQGVSNMSHWGISPVSNITDNGFGVALTWFDNVPAANSNYFELIPEPSTVAFLMSGGCGMGLLALFRRRRTFRPPEE